LKIPITLLITAVLAFLFTSQKETYSDLFKYVTAAVAAAPLLVQVFNIFKSDPAQANKAA
jgi:ABC-type arginine/histidine transport system permease subunit